MKHTGTEPSSLKTKEVFWCVKPISLLIIRKILSV